MDILLSLLIVIVIITIVVTIMNLSDKNWKDVFIGLLIILLCASGCYWIIETDSDRALETNNIKVEYARVNQLTEKTLVLDNSVYVFRENGKFGEVYLINQINPINLSEFKEGDIVRYQYAETSFARYIMKIEKIQ